MKQTISLAQEGKINENASIKDQHSIIINAPIERVWNIVSNVAAWPEWNGEIKNLKISEPPVEGTKFDWKIGRMNLSSQIQLMEKPGVIAFTGKSTLVKRIYVWSFETDDKQTIASLSTSLQGWFTVWVENHRSVYNELLSWLELLKQKAEGE